MTIEKRDRAELVMHFPLSNPNVRALGEQIIRLSVDEYELTNASVMTSGHQRDPETTGLRLVFTR